MKNMFKKIISIGIALSLTLSFTLSASAFSPVYKNRAYKYTVGTPTGSDTFYKYYQTAIDVEGNYYKLDGYAEIHLGSSTATKLRYIKARAVTYNSGTTGADDTLFKTSTTPSNNAAYWEASYITIKAKVLYNDTGATCVDTVTKKANGVSTLTYSSTATSTSPTRKLSLFTTLEAKCPYLDNITHVSYPVRTI